MPVPKPSVKVYTEDGVRVEFTDFSDATEYTMKELCRAALRDTAKFVRESFKEKFYGRFGVVSGRAGKATRSTVYASESTIYPRVDMGLRNAADGGWAYFQEVGTSKTPRLGLLTKTVEENVATIVAIHAHYLAGLDGEHPGNLPPEGDINE